MTDVIAIDESDSCTQQANAATLFDGVDLEALASRVGTPLHVYSATALRQRIAQLESALQGIDALVCFAVKANPNVAILKTMAEAGLGADIVSVGELRRSLRAGMPAQRIVFSGVGKRAEEIAEALDAGILKFNVESLDELHALQKVACERGCLAHAAARINPDVDASTHAKIATGKAENKFGVSIDIARTWFADAAKLTHVCLDGLHVHIGSQILSLEPFRLALQRIAAFWRELAGAGHAIASIDVGGGLGVAYHAGEDRTVSAAEYVGVVRDILADFAGRVLLEPGRWLIAEAGVLLTRVILVKQGEQRRFLVVDAAMNDLLRPTLYDAWHEIVRVGAQRRPADSIYDVVGPVCESGDTFARDRAMPTCQRGDLLAIQSTGAYAASMASTYNSRPLAAEVMVEAGRYAVVRRRQSFEEMIAGEQPAQKWETT